MKESAILFSAFLAGCSAPMHSYDGTVSCGGDIPIGSMCASPAGLAVASLVFWLWLVLTIVRTRWGVMRVEKKLDDLIARDAKRDAPGKPDGG